MSDSVSPCAQQDSLAFLRLSAVLLRLSSLIYDVDESHVGQTVGHDVPLAGPNGERARVQATLVEFRYPENILDTEVTFTVHPGDLKALKLDEHGLDACAIAVRSLKRHAMANGPTEFRNLNFQKTLCSRMLPASGQSQPAVFPDAHMI